MNRTWLAICGMIAAVSLQSCDSGDIYPAEDPSAMTRTLDIRGTFTGNNTVPSDRDRKLMVFTYPDGSGESNRSVRINSIGDGETTVSVSLVPSNASNFVMAITDQGNSVMYEICSGKFETGTADAEVDVGNVDMLAYNRLQTQLYDQSCTSCHGSANPSAGLVLDAGVSYMNTVNHATANGSGTIIKPFDIPASVMASKLGDPDDFHSRFSTLKANDTELLRAWILAGAKSD